MKKENAPVFTIANTNRPEEALLQWGGKVGARHRRSVQMEKPVAKFIQTACKAHFEFIEALKKISEGDDFFSRNGQLERLDMKAIAEEVLKKFKVIS